MTLQRLRGFLGGYVRVEVSGKNPERLVNLCLDAGYPIWDLSRKDKKIEFSMPLAHYKSIRPLARRARCVPKIRLRRGVPFVIGKIRRRRAFVLASLVLLSVLLYLSGAVWSIQVRGAVTVKVEDILRVANEHGLRIGARKSLISTDSLESGLTLAIPRLSWAYIYFQGTLAVIEVVEKVRPDGQEIGDVVASKDGVVESVLVLAGTPVVTPGQTVKAGEILIAGNPTDTIQGARGTVTAKTWYEVYREIPLIQTVPRRTGAKMEFKVLRHREDEFSLFGQHRLFDWYEIEDYPLRTVTVPGLGRVEIIQRVFYEVEWVEVETPLEEAKIEAETEVRKSLERRLPSSAKLIDLSCEVEAVDDNLLIARGVASVVEEIGVIRPWPQHSTGVDR